MVKNQEINKLDSNPNIQNVKNKILVLSGKGGVGKTTIAVNLAFALSEKGFNTGLLDVDIHGPNVPKMLNLENKRLSNEDDKFLPVEVNRNLHVLSIAFLLERKENAVIWRGPMKHKVIKQFIEDTKWGNLEYLVIDFPPGTGDEAISVSQILNNIKGSLIVSTPQKVALIDVSKAIDFSRHVNIPVIGLIENMSGDIFGKGTVSEFAESQNVNFLGSLELEKTIAEMSDKGKPFVSIDSKISRSFEKIANKIISSCNNGNISEKI